MARTRNSLGRSLVTGLVALGGRKLLGWLGTRDRDAEVAEPSTETAIVVRRQRRSKIVIAAAGATVLSFFLWPLLQLFLAMAGFGLGLLGLLRAQSPRVSGAGLALLSALAAVVSFVVALVRITW